MQATGTIDKKSLHNLIEWHITAQTDGLVIAGTTGEAPTLKKDEQFELLQTVVKQVAKRIPVIAGTGTNSTESTLELSQNAQKAGADACLIVTPYYNKPTQKGLYEHFKKIAENINIPIILYNVPNRTGCDLLPETVEKLAKIRNIIGIKEATGNPDRAADILKRCGNAFMVYSGDDATALSLLLLGAQGVISVTANVAPEKMHLMCKAAMTGNRSLAEKINQELMPLHQKLFLEPNPIPVKWAVKEMGLIPEGIRLPLTPFDEKFHAELHAAMKTAGVYECEKQ